MPIAGLWEPVRGEASAVGGGGTHRPDLCQTQGVVDWARFGADMEDIAIRGLTEAKRVSSALRPMTIRPYRGFVAHGVAHVRGRVLEQPVIESAGEGLRVDAMIWANLMRWVVFDMPRVEVTVTVGDSAVTATSDANGFVTAKVPVGDLAPGWHSVTFEARDEDEDRTVTAHGRVVQPDPKSQIAVISDIDDTILRTGMTEGLTALRRTMLRDAHGRKPVSGTPSFYRGLARGLGSRSESTFFYVSASPWNLYDMLVQWLQLRGFPRGPLFLTDWKPGPKEAGGGKENPGHKRARIRRLLDSYPELSFVLVGDSGEHDPEIYDSFLQSDPDRIATALIRDVAPGSKRSLHLRERGLINLLENKRESLLCDDVEQMARVAQSLGLIDELTIEEVHIELRGGY